MTATHDASQVDAPHIASGGSGPDRTPGTVPEPMPAAIPSRTRGLLGDDWSRPALLVGLAIALPLLGELSGILTDSRATAIGAGVVFVIAGLSLNVLTGYTGQLSLGHWALVGVGAFTSAKVTAPLELRLPWIVGLLMAVAVGAGVGLLLGLPSMRIRGLYLAIATVAFHFAMEFSLFASELVSNGSAGAELPRPYIGSRAITSDPQYLVLMALVLVVVVVIDRNLTTTRVGRSFQAVRADEDIAASFGIDVRRAKLLAFTISGAYAGAAGALHGHLFQFADARTFPFEKSLLLVAIVVIGGVGSRTGVIAAGLFFGIAPIVNEVIFGQAAESWDLIIGAAALLLTIAFNPEGLAGTVREHRERREEKDARRHAAEHVDDVAEEAMPALPSLPRPSGLPARRVIDGPVLDASDVTVDFGGLRAVDHASVRVERHRIVGLIGPNGAGKTTMFNAISGAVPATTGTIRFNGQDIGALRADQRAGLGLARTFQSLGLARDRSVTENLLLAQHLLATYPLASALGGVGPSLRIEGELRERARQTLDALGFQELADRPVRNLSGGQQRIVEIAAALLTAPELVMLDEPSAGMAPAAVENLAVRLREMRDDLGRTMFLIEHNIPLMADVCDEVYVMDAGVIIAHGTPAEAMSDPVVITAYLGEGAAT